MEYFSLYCKQYILICDYFNKFLYVYLSICLKNTCLWSLMDCSNELFSIKGYSDETISDNGSPFYNKKFDKFITSQGIKHMTSTPHYPQSNSIIEWQAQAMKCVMEKSSETLPFWEALTDLRATWIINILPSPVRYFMGGILSLRRP